MTDPTIEAIFLYHQFRRTCDDIDRRQTAWSTARSELGYSTDERWYVDVGATILRDDVVQAVKATVTCCVSVLGIARPDLRWFLPETDLQQQHRERYGPDDLDQFTAGNNTVGLAEADANTIRIRGDLSVTQAMKTAAHECRHLHQTPHHDLDSYIANEKDARAFEAEFARALLSDN